MTHFARVASAALAASRTLSSPRCRVVSSVGQTRCYQTPASEETTVIRVPQYLQARVENMKQARGQHKVPTVRGGKLLILSRNPELNQSAGYLLKKFEEPPLCSKGWKHRRSFGDYFIINNTRSVAPFVTDTEEDPEKPAATFDNLHICQKLLEVLKSINITHPTTVQLKTIPKVMRGHNILCAAETGSGKTLSYLLPAVNRMLAERGAQVHAGSKIRTLVLVPSRELAEQVSAVSRSLCGPLGLQTRTVGGGQGVGHIMRVFKGDPPDVLVATPGALVKALRRRCLDLGELRYFVVDEADTMFDPSFAEMLEKILSYAKIASKPDETKGTSGKAQLLLLGATFPGGVGEVLSQVTDLGSMVVIKSKMLHFLMPHVKQTFLKVRGEDKVLELNQALKQLQQDKGGGGVLVFCNKSGTVNWLGYSLEEMGVKHGRLQGEMPAAMRAGIFQTFQKGAVDVLVCTDIASRGLDTSRVRLVVNYDCPESHTDYIHRAGRVGRAGGVEDGEVLSLVTHPWDVELVQKIESAARRRTSLPGMESEIHSPKAKGAESEEADVRTLSS